MDTHDTNCEIVASFESELRGLAEDMMAGNEADVRNHLEKLGWSEIGNGMGRSVWRVPTEYQTPVDPDDERSDAVCSAPCVVKIPKKSRHDGLRQNSGEIGTWNDLPERIRQVDPPIFVPICDYDPDYYWLSMPEVDTSGGLDAERRLLEHGYECDDLYGDNVGTIDDVGVILDYGLDCREAVKPMEDAESVKDWLERSEHASDIHVDGDSDSATVRWQSPAWIGIEDFDPTPNTATMSLRDGIHGIVLSFGPWGSDMDDEILFEVAEIVGDRLREDWYSVEIWPDVVDTAGGLEIHLETRIDGHHPDDRWLPDMVRDYFDDAVGWLEEELDGVGDPNDILRDAQIGLEDRFDIVNSSISAEQRMPEMEFFPPEDAVGYEQPNDRSRLRVDGHGFYELSATFGPWRDGEPHYPPINDGASAVVAELESSGGFGSGGIGRGVEPFPLKVSWDRIAPLDAEPGDGIEVRFTISQPEDSIDHTDLTVDEIVDLYGMLLSATEREMPWARPDGAPVQETLDEFEAAVEAAIHDAIGQR